MEIGELDTLKKVLEKNKPDLVINRVPDDTLKSFKDLAEKEFKNDYGFTLKWLLDMYLPKFIIFDMQLQELSERISKLEYEEKKDKKTITLGNGKVLELK